MPTKKVAKKYGKHHENNAKAVVSLLVLSLAFFVFMLFNNYQDTLLSSSNFQMVGLLIVLLFGLLVGLLYLLNPSKK